MISTVSILVTACVAVLMTALALLYIRLSRAFAVQMLLLFAASGYVLLTAFGYALLGHVLGRAALPWQIGLIVGAAVVLIILCFSPVNRAAIKVQIAKNLFAHRYDYRTEWIRFTDTLGRPAEDAAPIYERVVKALADITESPAGLLLAADERGLVQQAAWNWAEPFPPAHVGGAALVRYLEATGRIVEIDALRRAEPALEQEAALIPEWMIADQRIWALVSLIHFDRLIGVVVLLRPLSARALDWEDFDLLRVVGRQIASYLAEAQGQEALSEARRFDEFNRRFAFIMHDIKNLVSQLNLVTRNAERHADNPDFRADMIATLQSSTAKMNDLLARLSVHGKPRAEESRAVSVKRIVESIAAAHKGHHPIVTMLPGDPVALAHPARLEQALRHLLQNAIEASPPDEPVVLSALERGGEVVIELRDRGAGMTQDFIRHDLFRPFASTKPDGFGIGAYEAQTLIGAMDGRLDVESRPGEGTAFTVVLKTPGSVAPVAQEVMMVSQ